MSQCSHGSLITAASTLSAFDILKLLDEYGTPVDPTVEYDFGLTLYACIGFSRIETMYLLTFGYIFIRKRKSFKCRFQLRHRVEALIRCNIVLWSLVSWFPSSKSSLKFTMLRNLVYPNLSWAVFIRKSPSYWNLFMTELIMTLLSRTRMRRERLVFFLPSSR